MDSSQISFVGVGRMGANMARRLKEVGYSIASIYDVDRDLARQVAAELGATAATGLAEVTASADTIFTVVTDDQAMRNIYFGDNNLFADASGKLFINCATISPAVHVEVADRGKEVGAHVLEAPMASSITHAREGNLYMMLAGEQSDLIRAEPILKNLAAKMHFIGAPGSAAQLKVLVNMVMNINTAGLAEGLGLADALGLDPKLVVEVFAQTGANSRVLETDASDMLDREHSTFFSAAHAAKDSGLAARLAEDTGLKLPLLEASRNQFERMIQLGLGEIDKSGVSELTFRGRHA